MSPQTKEGSKPEERQKAPSKREQRALESAERKENERKKKLADKQGKALAQAELNVGLLSSDLKRIFLESQLQRLNEAERKSIGSTTLEHPQVSRRGAMTEVPQKPRGRPTMRELGDKKKDGKKKDKRHSLCVETLGLIIDKPDFLIHPTKQKFNSQKYKDEFVDFLDDKELDELKELLKANNNSRVWNEAKLDFINWIIQKNIALVEKEGELVVEVEAPGQEAEQGEEASAGTRRRSRSAEN